MTNRYSGNCVDCGGHVAQRTGKLSKLAGKWVVSHYNCTVASNAEYKARETNARNTHNWVRHMRPNSHVTTFNSGESVYVNTRGRCEDAPCCGCCS